MLAEQLDNIGSLTSINVWSALNAAALNYI